MSASSWFCYKNDRVSCDLKYKNDQGSKHKLSLLPLHTACFPLGVLKLAFEIL